MSVKKRWTHYSSMGTITRMELVSEKRGGQMVSGFLEE